MIKAYVGNFLTYDTLCNHPYVMLKQTNEVYGLTTLNN